MNNEINKKKLKKLDEACDAYWKSVDEFEKLSKKSQNEITNRLINDESESSVRIEHKVCPRSC